MSVGFAIAELRFTALKRESLHNLAIRGNLLFRYYAMWRKVSGNRCKTAPPIPAVSVLHECRGKNAAQRGQFPDCTLKIRYLQGYHSFFFWKPFACPVGGQPVFVVQSGLTVAMPDLNNRWQPMCYTLAESDWAEFDGLEFFSRLVFG